MCGMLGELKITRRSACVCGQTHFCFHCLELNVIILGHCARGNDRIDEAIETGF